MSLHKSSSESSWELIHKGGRSCKANHLIKGGSNHSQLSCSPSCSKSLCSPSHFKAPFLALGNIKETFMRIKRRREYNWGNATQCAAAKVDNKDTKDTCTHIIRTHAAPSDSQLYSGSYPEFHPCCKAHMWSSSVARLSYTLHPIFCHPYSHCPNINEFALVFALSAAGY